MALNGLFRDEVLQAQRGQWLGTINLATPLSFRWWALLAVALVAAVMALLVFGHYTRRETVTGQLVPTTGLLTIKTKLAGTVTRTRVHQGVHVFAGEALVNISGDLASVSMGETHAVISAQLRAQEAQVRAILTGLKPQAHARAKDLHARIRMLRAQIKQINGQLALQRRRAATTAHLVHKIADLHRRGIVSTVEYDRYQANAMAQRAQVRTLIRQRLDAKKQSSELGAQLAQLPLDMASKARSLRGQLARLDAKLAENEAVRRTVLRAPRAGVVSTLLVKPGQTVAAGQSLLSILPQGSELEAQLLVPSSAIGFVSPGNRVVLRYQAYPYQKFGQQYGKVIQVSRSALNTAETATLVGHQTTTPLYRVLVALDRQSINAYGKTGALKPGMTLQADILLDSRTLWEWVFQPLYGLRAQFSTDGGAHR